MSGYRAQACDTTEAVDRLVFDGWRRMSPAERLRLASQASIAVERLSIAVCGAAIPMQRKKSCGDAREPNGSVAR